jgi:hypothetical protein
LSTLPTVPEVGLRNAFEACTFVDDLGGAIVGELVVNDADGPRGVVFVEGGRVCWAAARGLAPRLSELLGARAGLEPSEMESLFLACKERRIPLGEHLVSHGVLSAEDLRVALLQHTVESLRYLCAGGARGFWCPRGGAGYSPRFTFATAELLTQLGATTHASVAARLRPLLESFFGDEDWAAAFVRSETSAFPEPIAVRGAAPHAATSLVRFGKWAASVLDVAVAFSGESAFLSIERTSSSARTALVAFRHEGAVVTGETSAHGPARILNRRAQRRLARRSGDADV